MYMYVLVAHSYMRMRMCACVCKCKDKVCVCVTEIEGQREMKRVKCNVVPARHPSPPSINSVGFSPCIPCKNIHTFTYLARIYLSHSSICTYVCTQICGMHTFTYVCTFNSHM